MQTSYSINQAAGRIGGIADSGPKLIDTYLNPDAVLYFGHVATLGAAEDEAVAPDAAADITDEKLVLGVVVASHEMESVNDSLDPHYVVKSAVPIMRKGRVWCAPEDTITKGTSTVNVRYTGTGKAGALLGGAVSMETAVLPKARWESSTSGNGQLAILALDLI